MAASCLSDPPGETKAQSRPPPPSSSAEGGVCHLTSSQQEVPSCDRQGSTFEMIVKKRDQEASA